MLSERRVRIMKRRIGSVAETAAIGFGAFMIVLIAVMVGTAAMLYVR